MKSSLAHIIAAALLIRLSLAGCRSHVVKINLTNTSAEPIKTIIVDYPTATFGKDKLAPGETFLLRIKPLEKGAIEDPVHRRQRRQPQLQRRFARTRTKRGQ